MAKGKMSRMNAMISAAREKQKRAHELRLAGYTWDQIAEQVGYNSPKAAYISWKRALDRIPQEAVKATRRVEAERLDKLQRTIWSRAIQAKDEKTITLILKIMQRRASLLGLNVAKPMNATEMATTVAAITAALDQAEQHHGDDNGDEETEDDPTPIEDDLTGMPQ